MTIPKEKTAKRAQYARKHVFWGNTKSDHFDVFYLALRGLLRDYSILSSREF